MQMIGRKASVMIYLSYRQKNKNSENNIIRLPLLRVCIFWKVTLVTLCERRSGFTLSNSLISSLKRMIAGSDQRPPTEEVNRTFGFLSLSILSFIAAGPWRQEDMALQTPDLLLGLTL